MPTIILTPITERVKNKVPRVDYPGVSGKGLHSDLTSRQGQLFECT
jgi:hypothetical protein